MIQNNSNAILKTLVETTNNNIKNGTYTVISTSGKHRTFNISTIINPDSKLFGKRIIGILADTNNETDYLTFGFVLDNQIAIWKKFRNEYYEKVAKMVFSLLSLGENSPYHKAGIKVEASKDCLICNRKLTTPESIEHGIGPVCAEKVGL